MSSEVEAAVGAKLRARVTPRPGSLFKEVGDTALDAFARIEDVCVEKLTDADIIEFRSTVDQRVKLDVTNPAHFYDWLRESAGCGDLPGLFKRNGALTRVARIGEDGWIPPRPGADDGPAQVRPLTANGLMDIIQHRFWVYREKVEVYPDPVTGLERKRHTRTHVLVPRETCQLAVDGVGEWESLPEITAVTHTSMLRADGSLLQAPGYDAGSRTLHLPDEGSALLDLPASGEVQPEWVSWSRDIINYLLADFPFESELGKMNMIALMITPLMRQVIPPPYPMFIINAHQRGTGKSLLARICRTLHGGVHRPELPVDDDEIRKQITSILTTTTAPVINFDNVTTVIRSGQIANLLTTSVWSDRPLGRTATVEAANDRLWIATGNNVQVGGDLARRVHKISLDAATPRPEYRTGFRESDLVGYVRQHRGTILTALVVQLLWWVQRGMPRAEIRSDDYGAWAGAMTEILEGGGLDTSGAFRGGEHGLGDAGLVLSEDEAERLELLEALWTEFGGGEFMIKDIRDRCEAGFASALESALPAICVASRDRWKSLGRYLLRGEKQFVEDIQAVKVRSARGGIVWQLQRVTAP